MSEDNNIMSRIIGRPNVSGLISWFKPVSVSIVEKDYNNTILNTRNETKGKVD